LGRIFADFNKAGKPISVCGELAGDHLGALVMFGLGLRKFSMNAANIGRVKRTLSLFTLEEAEEIARKSQNLNTEAEVIAYLKAEVEKRS
jgi:phosphoenolpyruvate-protein kinase (PTS system EI component)